MQYVTKSILKQVYKRREPWVHKGNFGRLLVISGSERFTGAPTLIGLAAFKAGVDMVFIVGPRRAMDVAAANYPTFINMPLDSDYLEKKNVSKIFKFMEEMRPTAVVIGPGLWRTKEIRKAIIEIIKRVELPIVIDADAIRAMKDAKEVLKKKKCVLLPHADEFRELTGVRLTTNIKERINAVKEQARLLKTVLLVKGYVDIITDGNKVFLNKVHSNFMTKGGMGDTMAGICGALLARKIDTLAAACASAYINGKAGSLAAKKYKESLMPTDLINEISNAIR